MDILNFENIYQFSEFLYNLAQKELTLTAVVHYEKAKDLLFFLSQYDDVELESINLQHENYDGYDKEYYVTLTSELELYIESVYDGDNIKECYSDKIFYFEDVNSKIAIANECDCEYEIDFYPEDEDDDECGDCCYDCSNCPLSEKNEAIASALDFLSFIFNN